MIKRRGPESICYQQLMAADDLLAACEKRLAMSLDHNRIDFEVKDNFVTEIILKTRIPGSVVPTNALRNLDP